MWETGHSGRIPTVSSGTKNNNLKILDKTQNSRLVFLTRQIIVGYNFGLDCASGNFSCFFSSVGRTRGQQDKTKNERISNLEQKLNQHSFSSLQDRPSYDAEIGADFDEVGNVEKAGRGQLQQEGSCRHDDPGR